MSASWWRAAALSGLLGVASAAAVGCSGVAWSAADAFKAAVHAAGHTCAATASMPLKGATTLVACVLKTDPADPKLVAVWSGSVEKAIFGWKVPQSTGGSSGELRTWHGTAVPGQDPSLTFLVGATSDAAARRVVVQGGGRMVSVPVEPLKPWIVAIRAAPGGLRIREEDGRGRTLYLYN